LIDLFGTLVELAGVVAGLYVAYLVLKRIFGKRGTKDEE